MAVAAGIDVATTVEDDAVDAIEERSDVVQRVEKGRKDERDPARPHDALEVAAPCGECCTPHTFGLRTQPADDDDQGSAQTSSLIS